MLSLAKNPKAIAISLTVIMMAAIVGSTVYYRKANKAVVSDLNYEKLKTEQLLSEKLLLEKEITHIQNDLVKIKGDNLGLSTSLSKQIAINKSNKPAVNNGTKTIKSLRKEIENLRGLKKSLNQELAEARNRIKSMEGEQAELQKQIVLLNSNNKKLNEDLAMLQGISADQFALAAYKGKSEKLTVKAKKVNKLSTRFTVPSYIAANAGFKIKTPDGQVIDKTSKGMSMTIVDDVHETFANANEVAPTETMKEIELTYTPDKKLKSGAYKIELYNGGNYLTSCIINLK